MPDSDPLKDAATTFLRLAAKGDVDAAYDRHVAAGFRHHNPFFRGDATSLREAMRENAEQNPDRVLEIQRTLRDGDLVAVHSRVRQRPDEPGAAVVHLFRFENGRIAELWDVGQPQPELPLNEHGMF
jgi:predicted SnoaL-like aldol condensation-catalyzing enzyme